MKNRLQFHSTIHASIEHVFDIMLGLTNKSTYEQWTAEFNPTSTYEGTWEKGSKILFVGIDENGEKGGMVSKIAEYTLNQYVSIQHCGLFKDGQEIMEGPDVEKWANGFENYLFQDSNGITSLVVELDTTEDFSDFMNETYPIALQKLKEICEK